jgi:hypothetical protein
VFWGVILLLLAPSLRAQDVPPGLTAAVQAYKEKSGDHEHLPFRYALTDLNGDGRADAIVLLLGGSWCGSGGCNMLVFRADTDAFTLVSGSTIVAEPIRVSPAMSHGWNTLIVFSKGKGNVLMRFGGTRYPGNPSLQPRATPAQVREARELATQVSPQ